MVVKTKLDSGVFVLMLLTDGDGPRALRGATVNGGGFGSDQPGFGRFCNHYCFRLAEIRRGPESTSTVTLKPTMSLSSLLQCLHFKQPLSR